MIYRDIEGMKYMTIGMVTFKTDILGYEAHDSRIHLYPDGELLIDSYYLWNGANDPAIDTKDSMKASLGHDSLYHLIRLGKLPLSCKGAADRFLYRQLQKDGMNPVRALIWYRAVDSFGHSSCQPGSQDDKIREVA